MVFFGGLFTLLMLKAFFVDRGQGFVDLTGVVFGGAVFAVGAAAVLAGRRRARLESEGDARNFAETAQALARSKGGQVALEAVCKATGLPKDEVQARMRALTGQGLFDLDFDGNGQMIYRIADRAGPGQPAAIR